MVIFKNELGGIITIISWLAPTENTDGTAIDYPLAYQLYINDVATMVLPGTLNGERYEFALADVPAMQSPGNYTLTLTAFPEGVDLEQEPLRESGKSNALVVLTLSVTVPKEPADLSSE